MPTIAALHRRVIGGLVVLAALAGAGALAGGAASAERVVVPDYKNGSTYALRYKPSRLTFPTHPEADGTVTVTRMKWRNWGKRIATATGRLRAGDPDNGYVTQTVRVTLSRIRKNGCGDQTAVRQYTRAVIGDAPIIGGTETFEPLLRC